MQSFKYIIGAMLLTGCVFNSNAKVHEKSLENGLDRAFIEAFSDEASTRALDDISSISLEKIKNTVNAFKFNQGKLLVDFDSIKVDALLKNQGIATWNGLKTPVLVWLANLSDAESSILNGDSGDEFVKALSEDARNHNYTLMFPVMDLEDVQLVNAQSILNHEDEKLALASKRYQAKYFIAGVLEKAEDSYSVKWNAYDESGKNFGNGQAQGSIETSSQGIVKEIAKTILLNDQGADGQDIISSNDVLGEIVLGQVENGVNIQIMGLDNLADYASLKRIFTTYGYDNGFDILAYSENGVTVKLNTGSAASILDGTLAHATEFTKVGDWSYKFNNSKGSTQNGILGTIEKASSDRVDSQILAPQNNDLDFKSDEKQADKKTEPKKTVEKNYRQPINFTDEVNYQEALER